MKGLALLICLIILSRLEQTTYIIPKWRVEYGTVCYKIEQIGKSPQQKCCWLNLTDSSFIFLRNEVVFCTVDTPATFENLKDYFDEALPTVSFQVEQTFWLKAIIDTNGKIGHWGLSSSRFLTDPDYLKPLNKAILAMPRWKPAIKKGKRVNSLVTFPVRFTIK
jgi:hypothetical protein